MIKDISQMETEIRSSMRGGKGDITIQHVLREDELKGQARLVAKVSLEPGSSIGLHEHVEEEEIYYIMKGKGLVVDANTSREVGPGEAVLTGDGNSHSIENIGHETLEFFAVILTY